MNKKEGQDCNLGNEWAKFPIAGTFQDLETERLWKKFLFRKEFHVPELNSAFTP